MLVTVEPALSLVSTFPVIADEPSKVEAESSRAIKSKVPLGICVEPATFPPLRSTVNASTVKAEPSEIFVLEGTSA